MQQLFEFAERKMDSDDSSVGELGTPGIPGPLMEVRIDICVIYLQDGKESFAV